MATAIHDGVEIAYDVSGPPSAEPIVFVEGIGYGRWMWRWVRDALEPTYRTICFDNRGTGDSDQPEGPYTIPEMAGDLEAVLAAEAVDRAHVVGASLGGMIAQRYAIEYDRAGTLALCSTTHGGPDAVPMPEETQAAIFAVPEGADERETIRHRMRPAVSAGFYEEQPELVDRIVEWRLETDASDDARIAQAAAGGSFDASDELDSIDQPALVVHGTEDRVVPVENARLLADGLQNATLELIEGGPHLVVVETPEVVADSLHRFFAAHRLEET